MYFAVVEQQIHPKKVDAYLAAFRHQVEAWSRHHGRTLHRVVVVEGAPPEKDADIPVVILTRWRTAEDFTDAYSAQSSDKWMEVTRQIAEPVEQFRGYRPVLEQNAFRHAAKVATVRYLTAPVGTTAKIEEWARGIAAKLAKFQSVVGFRLLEVIDRPEEYIVVTEYLDATTRDAVEADTNAIAPPVEVEERWVRGAIRYQWMPLDQLVAAGV